MWNQDYCCCYYCHYYYIYNYSGKQLGSLKVNKNEDASRHDLV